MRILALVTDAFGSEGGIAQYNRDLVAALCSSNQVIAVDILPRSEARVAGNPPLKLNADFNVNPHKYQQHPAILGRLRYALRALLLCFKNKPDVVFCGHIYMAPLAWLLARLFRCPWWLQLHGIECWDRPVVLRRYVAERADRVTAVSRYTRRCFLAWANIPEHRVFVVPNTVGKEFTPGPKRQDLLERYGLEGKKVILTVARLSALERYKGHDRVMKVMPELLETHSDCIYLIVGDGDDRHRLKHLSDQLGIRKHVLFAGEIPEAELPDHFRLGDTFVMPSTDEGFGIVFLQAAMCGLNVVAGSEDGSCDALADGAFGALVPPTNARELLASIRSSLSHAPQRLAAEHDYRFSQRNFFSQIERLLSAPI